MSGAGLAQLRSGRLGFFGVGWDMDSMKMKMWAVPLNGEFELSV